MKRHYFETQSETERFAQEAEGSVVLLRRRDGQDSYTELGSVALPYEFGKDFISDDMKYGDAYAYTIHNLNDYLEALEEENGLIRDAVDDEDEPELLKEDADIVKELETFNEGDCMFLRFINEKQFYDVFRKEQTRWHDADGHMYRLAVDTEF